MTVSGEAELGESNRSMIALAIARSDEVDEPMFLRIRAHAPAQRRVKIDRYDRFQDRYASAVSFSLLQYLWQVHGTGRMPTVDLGEFGKPCFRGAEGWHFNLSHDGRICVCALANVPIGVDVQSRVPFDARLFERIAAGGEHRWREALLDADDLSPLWTRKEAVLKRTGLGLLTPMNSVDTLAEQGVITFSSEDSRFRLSVSAEGLSNAELLARLRIAWMHPIPGPGTWAMERRQPVLRQVPIAGALSR